MLVRVASMLSLDEHMAKFDDPGKIAVFGPPAAFLWVESWKLDFGLLEAAGEIVASVLPQSGGGRFVV